MPVMTLKVSSSRHAPILHALYSFPLPAWLTVATPSHTTSFAQNGLVTHPSSSIPRLMLSSRACVGLHGRYSTTELSLKSLSVCLRGRGFGDDHAAEPDAGPNEEERG